MNILFLVLAILAITIANIIKTARLNLFIDPYEKPNTKRQIQALAIANVLNTILPFRLGYLVRAWIGGKGMRNGRSFMLAAIIAEVVIDFVCMALVFAGFKLCGFDVGQNVAFYLIALAAIAVFFAIIYIFKKGVKHVIYRAASIFNKRIAFNVLKLSWFTITSLKNIVVKVDKLKLLLYTVLCWLFNVLSCWAVVGMLNDGNYKLYDVMDLFFSGHGVAMSTVFVLISSGIAVLLPMIYLYGSSVVLFISAYFVKLRYGNHKYINLLPHENAKDKLEFLKLYFDSDDDSAYFKQYLNINNDVAIIEDYSAGSNATTMLCSKNGKVFYRKYAFGDDAKKLNDQIKWIKAHDKELTLTKITYQYFKDNVCVYDMPYTEGGVTCFNFVHTEPFNVAWKRIKAALEDLDKNLHKPTLRDADAAKTDEYIQGKVAKNLKKIKAGAFIAPLQEYDYLYINGKRYNNLKHYEKMLDEKNLKEIFAGDKFADIHGDFTIENIICMKGDDKGKGYYIIDPNTGNLHDSPYLDYAKLLQSLHGGYEFLMNTKSVSISGNHIDFLFTKSSTYYKLYEAVVEYLTKKFGEDAMKSIFYHEIIHWLRLMPYKIEKNGERSAMFYAGMIMVMDDIEQRYMAKKGKKK